MKFQRRQKTILEASGQKNTPAHTHPGTKREAKETEKCLIVR